MNANNSALDGLATPATRYTGKFAKVGTKASGFASDGPYHCEDCIHLSNGACYHPAVMNDPNLPDMPLHGASEEPGTPAEERKQDDGGIRVDAEVECCDFVHPPDSGKD
jgi:hypothetical protein